MRPHELKQRTKMEFEIGKDGIKEKKFYTSTLEIKCVLQTFYRDQKNIIKKNVPGLALALPFSLFPKHGFFAGMRKRRKPRKTETVASVR